MRATLILFCLFGFSICAVASGAEHSLRFTVTDTAEAPFAEPVLRLVPIPDGTTAATARLAGEGNDKARGGAHITSLAPMIVRGCAVLPVVIDCAPASGAENVAPPTIEIEVQADQTDGIAAPSVSPARRYSRGFFSAFSGLLPSGSAETLASDEEGSYLIITHPSLLSAAESFAAWKREQGFKSSVVTTDQTGASRQEIQQYISTEYQTAEVPPEYVLLIGDVSLIPAFGFHSAVTDLQYSLVDGDDFFPDLFLGRISVQTLPQAETVVAKIIAYEREPFRGDGGRWTGRGLVVASNFSSFTPITTSRWCRQQMLRSGFQQVDQAYVHNPEYDHQGGATAIRSYINAGVSLVTYRGWADGANGWNEQFLSEDVRGLSNGSMLPVVFSFVCHNNDYSEDECFGEAWLRTGSAAVPKGGIGFIGNSEPWSHTRFNDGAAIGAFDGIANLGLRQLGQILLAAKMNLLTQFPQEVLWADVPDGGESVEYYFYIYTLLGDPSMELWTGLGRAITVSCPPELPAGADLVEVAVADSSDDTPVEGIRVGVSRAGSVLGTGWTDETGRARIPVSLAGGTGPVQVTVTGKNAFPYRRELAVRSDADFLSLKAVTVVDDGTGQSEGNGDGLANPAESLELRVTLHNDGGFATPAGVVRIATLDRDQVLVGDVPLPPLAAGGEVVLSDPLVVRIWAARADGFASRFRLESIAGEDTSRSLITLVTEAAELVAVNPVLSGGGTLLPGGAFDLGIALRNDGSVPAADITAVLRSRSDRVVVADSVMSFARVDAGGTETGLPLFHLLVSPNAPLGQAAAFTVNWHSAAGPSGETSFSLPVGTPALTAPLGPDQHGYWAYDSSDTDYPASAPLYDWIECSTAYGAAGTKLTIAPDRSVMVDLPQAFSFVYYGQSYRKVQVNENGWISFSSLLEYKDFYNWSLPSAYGCGGRIAAFWDNLDVLKSDTGGTLVGDGVYTYFDEPGHRFIIEWSRIGNTDSVSDDGVTYTDLQTFEIVLLDPSFHPAPGDEGAILFQYKQILNLDQRRMYSTVGIENATSDDGLEYTFCNNYAPQAAPLSDGLAIKFTTQKPAYSPFRLTTFDALPSESGVLLSWTPVDERPRSGYRVYRGALGEKQGPVAIGQLGPEARTFLDATADPALTYTYKIGSVDPVGRETLLGPYTYEGGRPAPLKLSLSATGGNPFRGSCPLVYAVPRSGTVDLRVYDVAGRLVRTLADGVAQPGVHAGSWDGRDAIGRDAPGGIYFARLRAGGEGRELKLTLMR